MSTANASHDHHAAGVILINAFDHDVFIRGYSIWAQSTLNDLPLLEAADLAVVVPGVEGPHPLLLPGLNSGRFQLAGAAHGAGWAEAVQRLLPPFFNNSCQSS